MTRAVDLVSPKFIEARTAKQLQDDMAALIIRDRKQYDFFSIQQLSNGKFIAWYRDELKFTYTKHLKERNKS